MPAWRWSKTVTSVEEQLKAVQRERGERRAEA